MTITEITQAFADKLAQIELYHRAIEKTAKKELEYIGSYAKSIRDKPEIQDLTSDYHSMYFYDARTGTARNYGSKISSIEDRYTSVILHKNKQYQWLLAEAYEQFEDFLEVAYAFAGHTNPNAWPMSDFGSISISELKDKTFDWYLCQAKKKRDIPHSVLNRFRNLFSDISNVEVNNALNVNLAVAINLIEKLRHVIVHRGGVVSDRHKFTEDVIKKAGIFNNGNYDRGHAELIETFFGTGQYENTVALLELNIEIDMPIAIHANRFGQLTGYLMAYAMVVVENL